MLEEYFTEYVIDKKSYYKLVIKSSPPFLPSFLPQAQKARIALLYFPLVPLVLTHVDRLNTGCTPYISPMLNATSMAYFSSPRGQSVEPPSLPGSAFSSKCM